MDDVNTEEYFTFTSIYGSIGIDGWTSEYLDGKPADILQQSPPGHFSNVVVARRGLGGGGRGEAVALAGAQIKGRTFDPAVA